MLAYLDEVLTLGFGDKGLKLRGSKCIDETSLGDDQEENLSSSEDGQLVSLREGNC